MEGEVEFKQQNSLFKLELLIIIGKIKSVALF